MEKYDGPERREFCVQHCNLSDTAKQSVPRWAFLSSLSTLTFISLIFAGWHVTSLRTLRAELKAELEVQELHLSNRIHDSQLRYSEDVERFIRAVGENRTVLIGVKNQIGGLSVRLGKTEAKQDLVLENIGLSRKKR